ncbi:hypothetical protein [Bdellovibrio bacteriovorus]|uniref:hypothetical protein n=1 Tax=Bdellovibrio bacteriovorus TaxID=959 RepID=UPI0035A94C05
MVERQRIFENLNSEILGAVRSSIVYSFLSFVLIFLLVFTGIVISGSLLGRIHLSIENLTLYVLVGIIFIVSSILYLWTLHGRYKFILHGEVEINISKKLINLYCDGKQLKSIPYDCIRELRVGDLNIITFPSPLIRKNYNAVWLVYGVDGRLPHAQVVKYVKKSQIRDFIRENFPNIPFEQYRANLF